MTLAEPHWHYLVLRCFKLNFRISWVLGTVWEVYNQLSLLFLPQISRLLPCISNEWPRNEKFGLACPAFALKLDHFCYCKSTMHLIKCLLSPSLTYFRPIIGRLRISSCTKKSCNCLAALFCSFFQLGAMRENAP